MVLLFLLNSWNTTTTAAAAAAAAATSGLFWSESWSSSSSSYQGLLLLAVLVVSSFLYIFGHNNKTTIASKNDAADESIDADVDGRTTTSGVESLGLVVLFVFSHVVCYYLWWSAEFNHGCLGNPFPLSQQVIDEAMPTALSIQIYVILILSQVLFAYYLPGPTVLGFRIPQENNRQLLYKCNGLAGWYLSLVLGILAHWTGVFDFKLLHLHSGALLSTAVLFADVVAVIMYIECLRTNRSNGSLQTFAHDFVMGQYLNPRLFGSNGRIDLKLWAEIRVSWLLLFALDVSVALHYYDTYGEVSNRLKLYLLIHTLYTNACMKGEESIPYTWDIFQECWGWMLIYWNLAGVAFAYTFNGRFLYAQGNQLDDLSTGVTLVLAILILVAYWIFDTANAQKNRFRAQQQSSKDVDKNVVIDIVVERPWAFPQFPNSTLHEPIVYLETKTGSKLLMDGWWKYARKPHYAADMVLSLLLCLPCGFKHVLPYFFVSFFVGMLLHREVRDSERCAKKYGDDWTEYCKQVPYVFVPGVY